jgi:hypothetical protein
MTTSGERGAAELPPNHCQTRQTPAPTEGLRHRFCQVGHPSKILCNIVTDCSTTGRRGTRWRGAPRSPERTALNASDTRERSTLVNCGERSIWTGVDDAKRLGLGAMPPRRCVLGETVAAGTAPIFAYTGGSPPRLPVTP